MKPYVKPAMLVCKQHPELGLWCREDGCVLVPAGGRGPKEHWTYGCKDDKGYMTVGFRGRYYRMHRLIAQTFLENPANLPEVDHCPDRNPSNNAVSNLRWADRKMQQNNRQICEDSLAKYGVRECEDPRAYHRARYENDPEYSRRIRATAREWIAKNPERNRTNVHEWQDRQRALGRHPRKCPDGKHHWLTDDEYEARFGKESQQIRLF